MKIVFETVYRCMMGSAIDRHLEKRDNIQLVLSSRDKLDLICRKAVFDFF